MLFSCVGLVRRSPNTSGSQTNIFMHFYDPLACFMHPSHCVFDNIVLILIEKMHLLIMQLLITKYEICQIKNTRKIYLNNITHNRQRDEIVAFKNLLITFRTT